MSYLSSALRGLQAKPVYNKNTENTEYLVQGKEQIKYPKKLKCFRCAVNMHKF